MLAKKGSMSKFWTAGLLMTTLLGGQTIHAAQEKAQEKTRAEKIAAQAWKDIKNFGFENMDEFIDSECYRSSQNFASCLIAADSISSKNLLTTETDIQNYKIKIKKILFRAGPFYIIETDDGSLIPEQYKKLKPKQLAETMAKDQRRNFEAEFVNTPELPKLISFARNAERKEKTEAEITAGFISNYTRQIDPYFSLTATAIVQEAQSGAGHDDLILGAGFSVKNDRPYVEFVVENSPAFFANFRQGDRVLKVDDKDTLNMTTAEFTTLIKTKADWKFEVQRKLQTLKISVTRQVVHSDTLNSSIVQKQGRSYLVLRYTTFMDGDSCRKISQAIVEAESRAKLEGIILDLRNNGGGRTDQAACIASLFLPKDQVVTTIKSTNGRVDTLKTFSNYELSQVPATRTNLPLAILLNGGSASASELLSGALRDYKRAWMIGDRTYGKGSVMSLLQGAFNGDPKLMVIATTGLFYQPDGTTNQMVGVLPDFKVRSKPNATDDEEYTPRNEDRVVGTLHASVNPAVKPKRAAEAARIEKCIDHKNVLEKHDLMFGSKAQGDYQLLYAMEVLRCN